MDSKKINILAYKIYLKTFYLLKKIEENLKEIKSEEIEEEFKKEISLLKSRINIRSSILGNNYQDKNIDYKTCFEEQFENLYLIREEKNFLLQELNKSENELKKTKFCLKNILNFMEDKKLNSDEKINQIENLIKPLNLKFEMEVEANIKSNLRNIINNHEKVVQNIKSKLNFFQIFKEKDKTEPIVSILKDLDDKFEQIENDLINQITFSCKKSEMRYFLAIEDNVKKTKVLI